MHRVAVIALAGADDGGRRSLSHIWFYHLREQDGDHGHADSICTGNGDSLKRHRLTVTPDNLLRLFGRCRDCNPNPVGLDRPANSYGGGELQALHAVAVRPPKGKSSAF